MKKYLHNRKTSEIECFTCGTKCLKPDSEILRNLRLNRKMFCSRSCSVSYGSKFRDRSKGNYYDISKHSRDKIDEYTPFRYMLRSCKKRFKECTLTLEDIKSKWEEQKGICPYTGFKMELRTYAKQTNNKLMQASVDRIDSNKGYIINNIEIICLCINYLKSDFTKEQVTEFLTKFKNSDFSEDRTISSS